MKIDEINAITGWGVPLPLKKYKKKKVLDFSYPFLL